MARRRLLTRRSISLLGAVTALAFTALRWWDPAALQIVRHKSFDLYQLTYAPAPYDAPVVIVAIDATSLDALGPWPWSRVLIADLATAADEAGATAIGFDMVFAEADRTSPSFIAHALRGAEAAAIAALARMPDHDVVLAERLAALPSVLGRSPVTDATPTAAAIWPLKATLTVAGPDPGAFVLRFIGWARNLAELEDAARGVGALALETDPDGVVRRPPLLVASEDRLYPSLALEALRVAMGATALEVRTTAEGVKEVRVGGLTVPTDRRGRLWLRAFPASAIPTVSAAALLEGDGAARAAIQGRIVLVGASAPSLANIKPSARGRLTSTETQAITITTMLAGELLQRPAWTAAVEMAAVAVMGLVLAVVLPALGLGWATVVATVLVGGYATASWLLFRRQGILLDASHVVASAAYLYLILVAAEQLRERSRRHDIKAAFAQYLAPALVDRLADRPEDLKLGEARRTMTFLFADLRGFTAIAERFAEDPPALTRLINLYFTAVTDRLLENRATIDKYMGDAVMAFWNAPLDDPDHARHACWAALKMIDEMRVLNPKLLADPTLAAMHGQGLEVGIGINTGPCLIGNVGSAHRLNYSVIGDAVNVASRLEGETRTYGVRILVGEATRRLVDDLAFLDIGMLHVRGRGEAERAFTLLGGKELAEDARFHALQVAQEALLTAMHAGDGDEARQCLAACRAAAVKLTEPLTAYGVGLDGLYARFEERVAALPSTA